MSSPSCSSRGLLTVEELTNIQEELLKACELYARKEKLNVLTRAEWDKWVESLAEHQKISQEIKIKDQEASWVVVQEEDSWALVQNQSGA